MTAESTLSGNQALRLYQKIKKEKDQFGEEVVDGLKDAFSPVKALIGRKADH